ncbi:tRNA uridine(34) 5-carboxymethylaminomethyl modification radical SAM/GNAT enzyme Elp3 [Candidatus Woesearchaeota archaeon]|nr:tRNA uridine(34) 5-carboxymethylaminomethyl modification radical SAM/GNAT enzyme Elp3 [Candidatus Woesearchaeota archaeon]
MQIPDAYIAELYEEILAKKLGKEEISNMKAKLCTKYSLKKMPTDYELLLAKPDKRLTKYLQTKPVRSISGVAPVAIMTMPNYCPHGKCTFCPGGPGSPFGDVPMSYTGKEPASMRGMRAHWDPYLQVFNRLEQYVVLGHSPEKVDLIIMGGTVMAVPNNYAEEFVAYAFKAMNDFSTIFYKNGIFQFEKFKEFFEINADVGSKDRVVNIHKKLLAMKGDAELEKEQEKNETAQIRCIGLTIETKPDWGFAEHGNRMLHLGCTRVELGIQSTFNEPLLKTGRGHTLMDNIRSIRELKDLGFKLNFHYMLGLPGMDPSKDLEGFKRLFSDPDFQPDMLKIYPCMVMEGTELYKQWKTGRYTPYTTETAGKLIAECKRFVPKYCRIMRVQRDIPTYRTQAGVDRTNLRQYITEIITKNKMVCQCIRCREIKQAVPSDEEILYGVVQYAASGGQEFFIEAKTADDKLVGFCRLRFPSQSLRPEITTSSAIVRELHVYGPAVPLEDREKEASQHRGVGKHLLQMAEDIASVHHKDKIVVISGVGVREYYKKRGYGREGPYMVKQL